MDVVSPYCQLGIQLWILVEAARLLPFYICFGNPLSIHRVGGLLFFHSFYSRLERFLNEVRKIWREASKRGKWTLDVLSSSSLEAVHNICILYSFAHTLWVTSPPTMDIGSTCALSSWFAPLRAYRESTGSNLNYSGFVYECIVVLLGSCALSKFFLSLLPGTIYKSRFSNAFFFSFFFGINSQVSISEETQSQSATLVLPSNG